MNHADTSNLTEPTPTKAKRRRTADGEPAVIWKPVEWDLFAATLDARHPNLNLLMSPDLAGIGTRMLNDSGALMPRPRKFVAIEAPRTSLLAAFARLRAAKFRRGSAPSSPPSALDALLDGDRPRAAKIVVGSSGADSAAAGSSVNDWTRDEWLAVVTEIHRAFPVENYPQRAREPGSRLTGLDAEDVAFAQRVLPSARQVRHLRVVSFATLRARLVSAFCDLHNRLSSAAVSAPAVVAVAAAKSAAVALPVVPVAPVLPVAAGGELEAAIALLATVFARSLANELRPMLAQLLREVAPPVAASAPVIVAAKAAPEVPRIRRPSIGVFGNRSADKAELDGEFPGIEFHCIVSAKQLNSIRNCDKVVVMTSWVGHSSVAKVKAAAGDRFVSVEGSLSALKRQITLWISSGELSS